MKKLILKLIRQLRKKSFRKYAAIGGAIFIASTVLTAVSLYIGRELLGISLLILTPIVNAVNFCIWFVTKYLLYEKFEMLKGE